MTQFMMPMETFAEKNHCRIIAATSRNDSEREKMNCESMLSSGGRPVHLLIAGERGLLQAGRDREDAHQHWRATWTTVVPLRGRRQPRGPVQVELSTGGT